MTVGELIDTLQDIKDSEERLFHIRARMSTSLIPAVARAVEELKERIAQLRAKEL